MNDLGFIEENIEQVREKIEKACNKAGRKTDEVTLIAVSKTKPATYIKAAYDVGIRDFGENKVQEILSKVPETPADIKYHMIGHLQRNKVKQVIDKTVLIHSVDSFRLADQINSDSIKAGITTNILIEINAAEEESKFGLIRDEVYSLVDQIAALPNVRVRGLMTVAPYTVVPEENRQYFEYLRKLAVDIDSKKYDNVSMNHLSMGMTGDYEIAIEEGATLIRVGTGIFGERNYSV